MEQNETALQELDLNAAASANIVHPATEREVMENGTVKADGDTTNHEQENHAGGDDDSDDQGASTTTHQQITAGAAPKKKKKKKPKSKRGLNAPTGFEEYYVDAPVTPAEYEEEKEIYHPSRNLAARIETAIQRYRAKRKMDSERKDLFDKYLSFGGIDTSPKMFSGGLDANMLSEHNAKEIQEITATDAVGADKADIGKDSSTWVVDFEGVAKAFLSSRLMTCFDCRTESQLQSYISIIRNFLNYLLHHDVCPEYTAEIQATRKLCDQADVELWKVRQASWLLPGKFNMACSTLFGGYYHNLRPGEHEEWAKDLDCTIGMSEKTAWRTFKFGLAALGSREQAQYIADVLKSSSLPTISEKEVGLEITELIGPDMETKRFYKDSVPDLSVLGKIRAREWRCPALPDEDLTEEERMCPQLPPQEYEFWLEEELLDICFVGMKMECTIRELKGRTGLRYFDSITAVYASFYEFLPNEMMVGWRDPKIIKEGEAGKIAGVENGEEEGEGDDGLD